MATRAATLSRAPSRRVAAPVARPARPRLEVVARPRTATQRLRIFVLAMSTLTFLCLLGAAACHVLLTQGQFQLTQLERKADESQARYDRLRLQVAELESPARIVAAAQERLGMVPPPEVTYLTPESDLGVRHPQSDRGAQAGGASSWSRLKPHLVAAQP